jgi:hypothetical protein
VRGVAHRVYSPATRSVVLRRDLAKPLKTPAARIPLRVREATDADGAQIRTLFMELSGSDRRTRERFLELRIGTCYVAVDDEEQVCYVQWLVGPEHNRLLDAHTNLPLLQDGEALLENAFTPAALRGRGIMSCAMAQIAERATELPARWVITVVSENNVPSIKGCVKAGFDPYRLKLDGWRALRHRICYTDLPSGYALPGI